MSKQKSQKSVLLKQKRITTSSPTYTWNEKHFLELYPFAPQIPSTSAYFTVTLNYNSSSLKVKLPVGVETKHLPFLFHQEIYRSLLVNKDQNPLLKTALVVGFETTHCDLLLDYRISIGEGILSPDKLSFNCLLFSNEGRLKKYKICKCLAIGGFSKVYLVRSLVDGQFYAMKVMLKQFIC